MACLVKYVPSRLGALPRLPTPSTPLPVPSAFPFPRTCHVNGWTRWMAAWTQLDRRLRDDEMKRTRRSHRIAANVLKIAVSSKQLKSAE